MSYSTHYHNKTKILNRIIKTRIPMLWSFFMFNCISLIKTTLFQINFAEEPKFPLAPIIVHAID